MDKIKTIIVDDSPKARKLLQLMIAELAPDIDIIGEADDVEKATKLIKTLKPQLVFLDIEMPSKSGLQLVEEISKTSYQYDVIFTTAYNQYALNAFRLSAVDYLLKPINEVHLLEAIEKIKQKQQLLQQINLNTLEQNLNPEKDRILCVQVLNGTEFLKLNAIEYLKADGSYVNIYQNNDKPLLASKNLKFFEDILLVNINFKRVHRSYIVNVDYIKNFQKNTLVMKNGTTIKVARDRIKAFLQFMNNK